MTFDAESEILAQYIQVAMQGEKYQILEDDGTFFGEIPGFQGVWANASTLEGCREELQEVLKDWIQFGLDRGHSLPDIEGVVLNTQPGIV